MSSVIANSVSAELVAVLVAVTDGQPRVLTTHCATTLPAGPFQAGHRSLQSGLRSWVEAQTHHPLGYVEQLYTFADRDRGDAINDQHNIISISYLGLTRESGGSSVEEVGWQDWYRYFPWEERRDGPPDFIADDIVPDLIAWATAPQNQANTLEAKQQRRQRIAVTFGLDGHDWNEDLVLQRYELLYEAGLVPEARRINSTAAKSLITTGGSIDTDHSGILATGVSMGFDHRRILATGIARLRAKIKYRPVVFELMPPEFTLLQLQQTVEALAGRRLHKQNFRRQIEQQALVEETGGVVTDAPGRPAKLFRFRGDVVLQRAIAGSKLPLSRQL